MNILGMNKSSSFGWESLTSNWHRTPVALFLCHPSKNLGQWQHWCCIETTSATLDWNLIAWARWQNLWSPVNIFFRHLSPILELTCFNGGYPHDQPSISASPMSNATTSPSSESLEHRSVSAKTSPWSPSTTSGCWETCFFSKSTTWGTTMTSWPWPEMLGKEQLLDDLHLVVGLVRGGLKQPNFQRPPSTFLNKIICYMDKRVYDGLKKVFGN